MNIYIILAILIANLMAIGIVYQFIKKLPKSEKIIFMAVSVAAIYILVSIIYWMSGFGIDKEINESAKSFVTYIFVPINVILFIPFIASGYVKYKEKRIKKGKFINRCILISVIALFVLFAEFFYFKSIQNNISIINKDIEENQKQNILNEDTNNVVNGNLTNIIDTNVISNTIVNNNEIGNKISNTNQIKVNQQ